MIKIIEYLNRTERNELQINNIEALKVTEHENTEFDTAEIVYKSIDRTPLKILSRVNIDDEGYNWYITSRSVKLIDKQNSIYEHTIILTELKYLLTTKMCSNLSFNNFLSPIKKYPTLKSVVKRLNLTVPFETVDNLIDTRLITSKFEDGGTSTDILPLMTDQLDELLTNYTDVPEFAFEGRNFLEALTEVFSLIGGTPKIINTESDNKVLDIQFFDNPNKIEVDMSNYMEYEDLKNNQNYSTNAEITTNNIVDNNSLYVAGIDFYKHIGSEDKVLDEAQASFKTNLPIYRLISANVRYKPTNQVIDATEYIKSTDEWNILPVNTTGTSPSTMNTLKYQINAENIIGFSQKIRKYNAFSASLVWVEFIKDIGFTTPTTNLFDYVMEVSFIPLQKGNRFNVKPLSFIENNIDATIQINIANRINESSKVIKNAQNKISQANTRQIIKKFRHLTKDQLFPMGARDIDTGFKIVTREYNQTFDNIFATYVLVRDTNVISDIVGVNSINRPTDVEIGNSLNRNEIYEDYCIFTPYNPEINVEDTSSVKSEFGKKKFINLFTSNHDVNSERSQQFLLNSNDIVEQPLVTPSIVTGLRTLNFDLNFLNQAYVENKIVEDAVGFFESKDVEQGVRYTLGNATLESLNLIYGLKRKKDANTITASEIKLLPEEQGLLYTDDTDPLYEEPIIEIGTNINATDIYSDNLGDLSGSYSKWLYFNSTSTEISQTYTIDTAKQRARTVNLNMYVEKIYNKAELILNYTDIYGVERQAALKTYLRDGTNDLNQSETIIIGDNIQSFTLILKVYFKGILGIVNCNFSLTNIIYNYIDLTASTGYGLYVEKNPNEVLGINYQMHYISQYATDLNGKKYERIILGSALTRNSPLILNNNNNYTSFKVYGSTEYYGLYEDRIKGQEYIGTTFSCNKIYSNLYRASISQSSSIYKSIAIAGVRADNSEDFMFAVNMEGASTLLAYIYFSHTNPMLITNN